MHLVDCFVDVFSYVRTLIDDATDKTTDADVRAKIEELFASKAHLAIESGYRSDHFEDAKFAVCTWIDEQVLGSALAFKDDWRARLLQKHYFNTVKGGQQFFERLNRLDQFDAYDMDVREVYFYCLAFGFQGKYFTDAGLAELASIRQTNLQLLSQKSGAQLADGEWFSQRPIESSDAASPGKPAGWAIMFGLPLLIVVASVSWMRLDVLHAIENLIKSF